MISVGFKSSFEVWGYGFGMRNLRVFLSCLCALRDSGFHFHNESSPALRTLILNCHPVVPLVVGDFCQLTPTALDDASLQIEAVHPFFRVKIDFIRIGHSLSPPLLKIFYPCATRSPRRIPQIVFPSTISSRSIISMALNRGTISTVRDCSPSSRF